MVVEVHLNGYKVLGSRTVCILLTLFFYCMRMQRLRNICNGSSTAKNKVESRGVSYEFKSDLTKVRGVCWYSP